MVKARTKRPLVKFGNIKELHCFSEVKDMLIAGFPAPHVAQYIQKDMHEYTGATRATVINALILFRKSMSDGEMVIATLPRIFQNAKKRFGNKMQELERLEDMLLMQQYRMDVLHGKERMDGSFDPQLDRMQREMRETIKTMHVIKMDLGLIGSRDLGTLTISAERLETIKNKYGENAAKAMADPVSRGRVLAALGAMNKAALLKDANGEMMDLGDKMNLTKDESLVVDADFEVKEDKYNEEEHGESGYDKTNDKISPRAADERYGSPKDKQEGCVIGEDDGIDTPDSELPEPADARRPTVEEELSNPRKSRYPEKPIQPASPHSNLPPGPKKARIRKR